MKFEGLIFTLFLVGILLTVSISQNITGLAIDSSEEVCRCVEIPTCTNDDKTIDLCLNVRFEPSLIEGGPVAYSLSPEETARILAASEPKPTTPTTPTTVDISKLIQEGAFRDAEPTPSGEVTPPTEKKCPDVCGPYGVSIPFMIYHFKLIKYSGVETCISDGLRPATNCASYPYSTFGSYKKCVIVSGIGKCVSTSTTQEQLALKGIIDYIIREGYGDTEKPPPPSPE